MSDKKIVMPLEEIMGERFGRYSKYIIQDRALPDVRDGLKPVQRRILYAMYKEGNVFSKPYRKSAKTVGTVIGNYHPHGDTSVYDAMIRLSQDWKMRVPLIDVQGNNGSIDNDPAAAMRYTEARLSKISGELLKDLDKETCVMTLNFDDTEYEPTVLPAKFPNLLVNGAQGISAGYATEIPPHNLSEVIDATIYRISHPFSTLEDMMKFIPGPDFPTGGICEGKEGILEAFSTGKGKVILRAKTAIEEKKSINQIVITEIPFEVNKAELVRKMDEIRFNKSIDGILEVRDESDRSGLRIVVDLKKEAPANTVLNYFFKNTDLQKYYNYNMIAICEKRPVQLGLLEILDAYISHQIEVITKRSLFELEKTNQRSHIVDGLIKAISILDDVVYTIRHSKDKGDAKLNIMKQFGFTERQAEAIVMLQLYRLTNTDILSLQEEKAQLDAYILELNAILDDDKVLRKVIIKELKDVKTNYPTPRLTEIVDEVKEITIDKEAMIIPEDVIISITYDGYVKRISSRSYKASEKASFGMKEDDKLMSIVQANTLDKLLLFTSKGNYLYVPVNELEEFKWKDMGKHISYLVKLESDEKIVSSIITREFREDLCVMIASKLGMIKRTALSEFNLSRYSKAVKCMGLKDNDEVVDVHISKENDICLVVSDNGRYNLFNASDITKIGVKGSGVKCMNLTGSDTIISMQITNVHDKKLVVMVGNKGGLKKIRVVDLEVTNRNGKGMPLHKNTKTNPQLLTQALILGKDETVEYVYKNKDRLEGKVSDLSLGTIDGRLVSGKKEMELDYIYVSHTEMETAYEVVQVELETETEDKYEILTLDQFLN